jgi:hypothetical protein
MDRIKHDYKDNNLPSQFSNVRVSTDLPDENDKNMEFLQKNLNRDSISDNASDISKDKNRQMSYKIRNESLNSMDKNLTIPSDTNLSDSLNSLYTRIEVKNFFSVYDISAMDEIPANTTGSAGSPTLILAEPTPWLEVCHYRSIYTYIYIHMYVYVLHFFTYITYNVYHIS